jgi:hypothetical protein
MALSRGERVRQARNQNRNLNVFCGVFCAVCRAGEFIPKEVMHLYHFFWNEAPEAVIMESLLKRCSTGNF